MKNLIPALICLFLVVPCQARIITVDDDGPADFNNIQAGIDDANDGDIIEVFIGTYFENIEFNGKNIILSSIDPNDVNVVANTIIDANNSGTVVKFSGTETSSCILSGFTVTGGDGPYGGGIHGGNYLGYGTEAIVKNCIITGNKATYYGGGIYYYWGVIKNCTISNNYAGHRGGGLAFCRGNIENCTISNNYGDTGGGLAGCDGNIRNCIIAGNSASGGSYSGSGLRTVGGLLRCDGEIRNCTIVDNSAGYMGGLYLCEGTIKNNIIWGNSSQMWDCSYPSYCCIQGWGGAGTNINDDPLFVDPINGNYHISVDSPCFDAGNPATVVNPSETDIDGEPRVAGQIDIGADEVSSNASLIFLPTDEFQFTALGNYSNPEDQNLTIIDYGLGDLKWSISEDCLWLEADPSSGVTAFNENSVVTLSVDISGLDYGSYDCQLTVSDPNAENSPQLVDVQLDVIGPLISTEPANFEIIAHKNEPNVLERTLSIENTGYDTLNWQITVPNDCNWLEVYPLEGQIITGTDEVLLTITPQGLSEGWHLCQLVVIDTNALNSPHGIDVNLHISRCRYVPRDYPTIQEAIDAAVDGDEVVIEPGWYEGEGNYDIDFLGKAITVRSINPENRDIVANTIVNCDHIFADEVFRFVNGEGADSILNGLSIFSDNHGADEGIYCQNSSPVIRNCIIKITGGIGIKLQYSSAAIEDCIIDAGSFQEGRPIFGETGIRCYFSNPVISGCRISNHYRSGIESFGGDLTVANCIFSGNDNYYYELDGGGILALGGRVVVENCTFVGNKADYGGAIYYSPVYDFCFGDYLCDLVIKNSIFRDNSASEGASIFAYSFPEPPEGDFEDVHDPCIICSYNTFEGGESSIVVEPDENLIWGPGNIDIDPFFAELGFWDANSVWVEGDYHLKSEGWRWDVQRKVWKWDDVTSRCIDAGNPGSPLREELLSVPDDPNNEWGQNIRINMGAYGGTAEASMPPYDWALLGDLTNDGKVDLNDLAAFVDYWPDSGECIPSDLSRNQFVDFVDFALLGQDWFLETSWYTP